MEVVELKLRDSVEHITTSFSSTFLRLLGGRRYRGRDAHSRGCMLAVRTDGLRFRRETPGKV